MCHSSVAPVRGRHGRLCEFYAAEIPVAAICFGTLEVVRAGLTRNVRHTSNALEYIKTFVSDYRNEDYYVNELAVTDGNLIAVSGLGSIEFAREIIRRLGIYKERDAGLWFELFKHGIYHLLPSQASPGTDGQKGAAK